MAFSVDSASATAIARAEQQARQQEDAQRASREKATEAARARESEQQAKDATKPPVPVVNEKGQATGGNVNTTA